MERKVVSRLEHKEDLTLCDELDVQVQSGEDGVGSGKEGGRKREIDGCWQWAQGPGLPRTRTLWDYLNVEGVVAWKLEGGKLPVEG